MALLLSLPSGAATGNTCSNIVGNSSASATLRPDSATARVLDRLRTDPFFTIEAAAVELKVADEVPDEVIGHLRWAIKSGDGSKSGLYHLLNKLKAGGRADVTDQFLEGLQDSDRSVRIASADGLRAAPPSKRQQAWMALIGQLPKTGDPSVHHSVLDSLEALAAPDLKAGSESLLAELTADRPNDVSEELLKSWKAKAAAALIGALGPEEALSMFRVLDLDDPVGRIATAGALQAVTIYAGDQLRTVGTQRQNQLRDSFRDYGVDLLAKATTSEEAARHSSVREAVPSLFRIILGKDLRPEDTSAISTALEAALRVEPPGTVAERGFSELQRILKVEVRPKTR